MQRDSYAALRIPDFRRLVLGHATSTVAREAQIVVVGWQVYAATHDPLSLGLIGLAEALPALSVALYAGHVADRTSRRLLAAMGTFGMLLSALSLLAFTLTRQHTVWPIYLVIFLSGIARSFTRPSVSALGAEIIPREFYSNGVAWRTSTWHFAAILGPALGGMLYGFAGPVAAYIVVAICFGFALLSLLRIQHRARPVAADDLPIGESLRAGVKFVFKQPIVLGAMTLDLFSVLFGGATALLPIFADLLRAGPQGLGILRAAPAVGSVLTGLVLAHRPPFKRAGRSLLIATALFGLTIIAFALSRNFYLSFFLLAMSGMADNISVVIRGTLVQTVTPSHLLGRVSAVNSMFIGASNEIGAFESGVAARLLGTVPSVIFGGAMCLVVVAIVAASSRSLREMREIHAP
jgi:hypothetical protein